MTAETDTDEHEPLTPPAPAVAQALGAVAAPS